jgi:hypothetical protein
VRPAHRLELALRAPRSGQRIDGHPSHLATSLRGRIQDLGYVHKAKMALREGFAGVACVAESVAESDQALPCWSVQLV